MLRFISIIRCKLAAENRVAKYLRYAIDEILMVVIGILMALQINNWNENRKEAIFEQKVLKEIQSSLADNITFFKRGTRRNNSAIYSCRNFKPFRKKHSL